MDLVHRKRVRTTETFRIEVKGPELLQVLSQELKAQDKGPIPEDASIAVWVPGGGDWSNTDLDLNEHPVVIEWTVEEHEGDI